MSDIAIKVENLSKKYEIGRSRSGSLRESLSDVWHKTFGGQRNDVEAFWALRDVSFEIKQGEAVGIIGRNGAGKSTLLKLLSKITYPTSGKITMNGRVSSLLEVGTGFHPELTGRENIYLNGTILGMSRREVKSKFDEIVAFSGVEKFLDTPVKRYSSGMYVRLAFAVAAHLEPEILIIDEVLAVGDAEFQKKCLGKMDEVAKGGRTVLFVSHNMAAIQTLCSKAMLLSQGTKLMEGTVEQTLNQYRENTKHNISNIQTETGVFYLNNHPNKKVPTNTGMIEAKLYCDEVLSNTFYPGCKFEMKVKIKSVQYFDYALLGFVVHDPNNEPIIGINNRHLGQRFELNNNEEKTFSLIIDKLPIFKQGNYSVDLFYGNYNANYDTIIEAFSFEIEKRDVYNSAHLLADSINLVYVEEINYSLK